jgi:hypothetical protein
VKACRFACGCPNEALGQTELTFCQKDRQCCLLGDGRGAASRAAWNRERAGTDRPCELRDPIDTLCQWFPIEEEILRKENRNSACISSGSTVAAVQDRARLILVFGVRRITESSLRVLRLERYLPRLPVTWVHVVARPLNLFRNPPGGQSATGARS